MNHATLVSYDHEVMFFGRFNTVEFILVKKYDLYSFINGYSSLVFGGELRLLYKKQL